ncbi:MAG: fecD [Paenibacillus sp.]|nr:fecD [Paenibacillus sp.]
MMPGHEKQHKSLQKQVKEEGVQKQEKEPKSLQEQEARQKRRFKITLLLLVCVIAVICVISTGVGAVFIAPKDVVLAVLGIGKQQHLFIIQEYRLPRILLAVLVGAGLSLAGAVLQGIVRNSLASPDIIGISKGAALAAVIVILLLPKSSPALLPPAAMAGAVAAAALLYLLSAKGGMQPVTLALSGIGIGALCGAGIQYVTVKHAADANTALLWLAGSLWGRGWGQLATLLPWLAVLLPLVLLCSRKLDVLSLGDDIAQGLGERTGRSRMLLLAAAVGLTGACVAVAGSIGFLGLIAPHIARKLMGPVHARSLPVTALTGSLLLLLADTAGRIVMVPKEVPAGIVIALIGAPYFLYFRRRESRW